MLPLDFGAVQSSELTDPLQIRLVRFQELLMPIKQETTHAKAQISIFEILIYALKYPHVRLHIIPSQ